jgi:hypothetical protein
LSSFRQYKSSSQRFSSTDYKLNFKIPVCIRVGYVKNKKKMNTTFTNKFKKSLQALLVGIFTLLFGFNSIAQVNCSCPGNLVLNPSYENGTTSWTFSGGTLNAGTGAVVCGSFSGDFQITNGASNWAAQTIISGAVSGTVLNASVYAGTHDASVFHQVTIDFFDVNWNWISSSSQTVNKVLANAPAGPQLYTWSATVPANCYYVNVGSNGASGYIKTDNWCVTSTAPCNNIVSGGTIGNNQTVCGTGASSDPAPIVSLNDPSGGTGTIEYVWMMKTGDLSIGGPFVVISGATSSTYDPGPITQTTNYIRCARRAGCTSFVSGESNIITVTYVNTCTTCTTPFQLVSNGNFNTASVSGFNTDVPTGNNSFGFTTNPSSWAGDWGNFGDHTTGTGDMMWFSDDQTGITNRKIWYQNYAVTAGQQYTFSVWVRNALTWATAANNPTIKLTANATQVGTSSTIAYANGWTLVTANYTPTASGSQQFAVVLEANNIYFDFVIDDVSLTTCTQPLGSIGDRVWGDANGNGIQDAGENNGFAGVIVQLKNAAGAVIATTNTDANGNYLFTGLAAGNYYVVFPNNINGTIVTTPNVGADDNIDSDADQTTGQTGVITLAAGQAITNVDAGYCPTTLQLGNRIWNDLNNNGINDGEAGIAGVTVNLYKDNDNNNVADGGIIETVVTDANGYYLFTLLAPGNYIVGVVTPAGYASSSVNGGDPDNDINLDDNGQITVGNETRGLAITLTGGGEPGDGGTPNDTNVNITYDFGFYQAPTGSIGNFVWNDVNGNGLQDAGEPGLSGVQVQLLNAAGAVIATTTTDANGAYQFTGLPAATYTVKFLAVAGYGVSPANVGSNDAIDSDVDGTGSVTVVLGAGESNQTIDAGFCPTTLALGDRVFADLNNNGIRDAAELGIAGVTVNIYQDANNDNVADGPAFATTTTDANGNYLFSNLLPGNYIVGVVNPTGYASSTVNAADPDNDIDLDDNGSVAVGNETRGLAITLTGGGEPGASNTNLTYDFGFYVVCSAAPTTTITQPTCTVATGSVTITAPTGTGLTYSVDAGVYSTTLTYAGLAVGNHSVNVKNALGCVSTSTITINPQPATPSIPTVTDAVRCGPGTVTLTAAGCTGGTLYWYAFGGSAPLATGVSSFTTPSISATTSYAVYCVNAAGCWSPYATATAIINNLPAVPTTTLVQPTCALATGSVTITAPVGTGITYSVDGGAYSTTTTYSGLAVGNHTINVKNDPGCISTATVTILAQPATPSAPTTTGASRCGAGTVTLTAAGCTGGTLSWWAAGGSTPLATGVSTFNTPSLTATTTYYVYCTNAAGCSSPYATVVATINPDYTVGDYVWYDQNVNGVQDAGETPIANVAVKLYADNNGDNLPDGAALATTTTNASGLYTFSNLCATNYIVAIVVPSGYAATNTTATSADPNNATANDNNGVAVYNTTEIRSNRIVLNANNNNVDFGLKGTASIGNFVFNDTNGNGIQDAGEAGIPGATVTLTYPNGQTVSVITDAAGNYSFPNLSPTGSGQTYSVTFVTPAGYTPATPNVAGSTEANDSDPIAGVVTGITLTAGQVNNDVDAGFFQVVNLGNAVWYDQNNNGTKDATDPVLAGVTVNLYKDSNNDGVADGAAIATTTTDAAGLYNFGGLKPDTYIVGIVTPAGYAIQTINGGDPDNNVDNDNNGVVVAGTEIRSNPVTLTTGGEPATGVDGDGTNGNLTVDFGLKGTGVIGNFVFNDTNGNGIQDAGEQGIPGATVTLTYPNGQTVSIITDAAGNYSFPNLAPTGSGQTYSVTFVTPAGYTPATPNVAGSTEANDSDPIAGVVTGITLTAGQVNNDVDAGFFQVVNLGNAVWYDQNNNGTKDATDPVIAGATVNLYLDANNDGIADGAAIATTTTDVAGLYSFGALRPDTYIVGVVTPAGYAIQTINGGDPDNNVDNDNNGVVVAGTEIRSNPITLVAGAEPAAGVDGDGTNGNLTVDFGLKGTASIGDFVFNDTNGNGIQDAGEQGIPGATVTLTYPNGQTVTTTTDAAGAYNFPNLAPTAGGQTYSVAFTTPSGLTASPANQGTDDTKDSDPIAGVVTGITLTAGQANTTVDAGFYAANVMNLGNVVWYDKNNNGIKDAGETGIPSASVMLYLDANNDGTPDGAAIATTTTDANGLYNFGGLAAGNYIVGVTIPAGYKIVTTNGGDPDNNVDNDNNGVVPVGTTEVRSNTITLALLTEPTTDGDGSNGNLTVDFALTGTGSIGNFVFNDIDGDGIQDAGEPGIAGVTVTLTYPDGTTVTTTTDASGNYNFPNLAPGTTYSVAFGTPGSYLPTGSNVPGSTDLNDSDPIAGVVTNVTVVAGVNNDTVDAGFYQVLNVGNAVWYDQNNNGTKDATDPVLAGVTVNLYVDANNDGVADGAAIATTTTDVAGLYNFGGLKPDTYIVGVVTPTGYSIQSINGGDPDNNVDNDNNGVVVVGTEIRSNPVTLTTGGEPATGVDGDGTNGNLTVDFGLKGTGVIGNFVFNDTNGNGIQDAGETGIAGTTVTLTYPNGQTATTTTDAAGNYSFPNLAPTAAGQTYSVTFVTPAGFTPTTSNIAGSTEANDSDPIVGVVTGITLTAGQVNNDVDAGFFQVVNLGNVVFFDQNNNGTKDATDPIIAGVTVNLYRDTNNDGVADGAAIATTVTDAAGVYNFTGLKPDTYIVGIVTPAGYAIQTINGGDPDNNIDNDNNGVVVAGTEIRSNPITLTAGAEPAAGVDGDGTNGNLTVDFGLKGTASIGDFVFNDTNGNGVQDAGEAGIPGATVTLTYPNGQTATTTTDAAGNYSFPNLAPTAAGQTYSVAFTTPSGLTASPANQGTDDTKDSDPIAGVVTGITLTAGQANTTVDAGFYAANVMNLGNVVWYDKNNNGIKDAGETGIPSASVMLYLDANNDGTPDGAAIATTTTDANGLYNFGGLAAGNYIVGVTIPAGYKIVTTNGGDPDNNVDNDNNGVVPVGTTEVRSNTITLALLTEPTTDGDGSNGNLTVDIALTGTGSIGNFVFNDTNGNGIQDAGEAGIPGVTVTLTYPDGSTTSTTTDANGNYNFPNLAPGTTYSVVFGTPSGFNPATPNQGGDDNTDSDPIGGVVTNVTVVAGVPNNTVDAGFFQFVNLGNAVWYDQNNNGTKDATDPVIAGATVNLYVDANNDGIADGVSIATTTTDASGIYNFTGLKPDTYIVAVVTPAGYAIQPINGGDADNNIDNDNNGVVVVGTEIRSNPVTLTAGGEPATGVDGDGTSGNLTVDFGLKGNGAIGNFVFNDANGNGIQDAGDAAIPGATVTLTYPNGQTVSTTTDASGAYSFPNLAPTAAGQTYSITFVTPAGFTPTTSNIAGSTEANDSDPIAGVVAGITLAPSQVNNDVDAGFFQVVNVGNAVWYDQNNNGTKDATDPVLAAVTVNLYLDANNDGIADGAAIATATTDAAGLYNFTGLKPDTYIVGIVTPAGYAIQPLNGGDPDNNVDNDNNGVVVAGTEIRSNPITLTSGAEPAVGVDGDGTNGNLTVDFGLKGTGVIGNFVFNDTNGNGIQDAGETGIAGTTVILTYPNGQTATTTTDAAGNYSFPNLAPTAAGQTYSVTFGTPAGYTPTGSNVVGSTEANDSDPIGGVVTGITLTAGQVNNDVDAGFFKLAALGNFVWNDLNADGIQDANEPGFPGVTVTLTKPDNTTLTATTDNNGAYSFTGLNPGVYKVTFSAAPSYLPSPANVGANDAVDSDPIAGVVNNITLVSGQTDNTIDAGFYLCTLTSGITGPLTICANEQTLFSATPSGVGSVYTWTFGGGATPATATGLSANPSWPTTGEFPITLLVTRNGCSVSYNTTIVITQGVFAAAGPDKDICQGSSTTINGSGPVGATYNWNVVIGDPTSIDNGANQQSVLVSPLQTTVYQLTVTQNGCTRTDQITVFINVNKNPIANAGPNKVVTVNHPIAIGGSPTGTPPLATPSAPLGYSWTAVTGLNDATIPNPSATLSTPGTYNYQVIVYSLLSGCSDTSVMQLTVLPGLKLGNNVWYDANNNGIKDAGEAPIATTVKLYKDDNGDNVADGASIATTTSDAAGVYGFGDLEPGNYIVGATIPNGYKVVTTNGGDPDNNVDNDNSAVNTVGTEARSLGVTLAVGAEPAAGVDGDDTNGNMTVDFGFTGNSSIGNFVFYDSNRDGIQTAGELGIAGVTVTLTFPDLTTTTATTLADGSYSFPNLIPGSYSVAFATPLGNIPTQSNVTTPGATDANDSDPVGGVVAVTLGANEDNATIDAGFHNACSGTITGNVFHDVDGMTDGIIDNITDTTGLPSAIRVPLGLRVYLVSLTTNLVVKANPVNINAVGTPATNPLFGSGSYTITNVPEGSYFIVLSTNVANIGDVAPNTKLTNPLWIYTGEKVGTGPGRDIFTNGKLNLNMSFECMKVFFGIKLLNGDIPRQ